MRYVGVDGGGTKTALCLIENGAEVAYTICGPLNYRTAGTEIALHNLKQGLDALLKAHPGPLCAAGIGDPGLDETVRTEDRDAQAFAREAAKLFGCPVHIRSDAYMALYAGTKGETSGVCLISGTGAMGIAERLDGKERTLRVAGGWGPATSDEGSGYYIGFRAFQQAARAEDGIGPDTLLKEKIRAHFGVRDLRDAVPSLYAGTFPDLAPLAPVADEAAKEGDAVASAILEEAAQYLAAYARTLCQFAGVKDRVYVSGSVLRRNESVRSMFERKMEDLYPGIRVLEPSLSPETAAALYAARIREENGG